LVKPLEALAARSDKDVRYGETRTTAIFEANTVLEPISPELVLVDPKLRREVRARLLRDLLLETLPDPGPGQSQAEPAPVPAGPPAPMPLSEALHRPAQVAPKRRKPRLAPALLPVSLALNVILIALSVSDARIARTTPSPLAIDPTPPNQPASTTPATKPPSTKKAQHRARTAKAANTAAGQKAKKGAAQRSARASEIRGEVEQTVLNTVIQSPSGKLPPALINPTTGLAKNGLEAYCRREARSPSFLCLVRPARHKPQEGLYVRYRPTRKGSSAFTWYLYKGG
jgi:hypothetical protein